MEGQKNMKTTTKRHTRRHPETKRIKYVTPSEKEVIYLYARDGKLLGYVSGHNNEITIYSPSKIKMSSKDKDKVIYYDEA